MSLGSEISECQKRIDNERRILSNIGERLQTFGQVLQSRPDLVSLPDLCVNNDPMFPVANEGGMGFLRCLNPELIQEKLRLMQEAEKDLEPLIKQRDKAKEELGLL